MKYIKKNITTYVSSFKKPKLLATVFLFDLLFALSLILVFYIAKPILQSKFSQLNPADLTSAQTITEMEIVFSALRNFFISLVTTAIFLLLFIAASFSLFQGLAWCRITKKKFTLSYLKKYTFINLIWFLSFIMLSFTALKYTLQPLIILSILTILFIYFTPLISYYFTKSRLKYAFTTGLKLHYLLVPILLIILTMFILSRISMIYPLIPKLISSTASIIILLSITTWAKLYLSMVLNQKA